MVFKTILVYAKRESLFTSESFRMDNLNSKEDLEKHLLQSRTAVIAHVITLIVTLLIALGIKIIWDPRWWIYVLILWVGPYGLIGDGINIWYCKKKLKLMME